MGEFEKWALEYAPTNRAEAKAAWLAALRAAEEAVPERRPYPAPRPYRPHLDGQATGWNDHHEIMSERLAALKEGE